METNKQSVDTNIIENAQTPKHQHTRNESSFHIQTNFDASISSHSPSSSIKNDGMQFVEFSSQTS
jgi:hypothetical protein